MRRLATIGFFWMISVVGLYGESGAIQKEIETYLHGKKYTGKGIGVVIKDLESGAVVVDINGQEMLNPASVSKLVTGAAAFEMLGLGYEFNTKIYIDGAYNRDSGVITGNLCLRGGGDPGFSAERLWLLVQHLYHMGVRKVSGDLVLDDFFFDSVTVGPGFDDDSSSRAYSPLISALSASFNTVAVHNRSGDLAGSPVYVDIFPRIHGVKVVSTAKTVESGKGGNLDVRTVPTSTGTDVVVRGSMSLNEKPKYIYRKVWQTWEMFGGAVLALFKESGIEVEGKIVHQPISDKLLASKPFYEFTSEPISVFVDHMFKYSSNFAAEMIFKTLASGNAPRSWERASADVNSWWKKCELSGSPVIKNGSGMGNINRISAGQVVSLLSHVWNQKTYLPEYLSALSVSGIDGTLKSRFKNSKLKGIVRAKTGTLNSYQVSTLAGYLLLPNKTYAFSILCNKVGNGQYDNWMTQEGILEKFVSVSGK